MRPDLENVTNEVLVGVDIKAANFHYIRNNTLKFLVGVVTDGGKVNEFDSSNFTDIGVAKNLPHIYNETAGCGAGYFDPDC